MNRRDRKQAGDARHAELAEHRAELHRRAYATKRALRVADDRRRPKKVLLQKVVQQVGESGRDAVVVLGAHHDERVGRAVQSRELLERFGGLPLFMLFVHAIQQRQAQLERVDERDLVATPLERPLDIARGFDTLTVRPHRPEDDHELQSHWLGLRYFRP